MRVGRPAWRREITQTGCKVQSRRDVMRLSARTPWNGGVWLLVLAKMGGEKQPIANAAALPGVMVWRQGLIFAKTDQLFTFYLMHNFFSIRLLGRILPLLLLLSSVAAQAQLTPRPTIRLDLISPTNAVDQTYVYFQAGATAGFDATYDASKLSNPSGLNLASFSGNTQLAINGLPPLVSGTPVLVPLFFGVPAFGTYRFQVGQFDDFVNTSVYLRDNLLNTRTTLALATQYPFDVTNANTNGTYNSSTRFVLEIYPLDDLVVTTTMTPPLAAYRNVTITSTGSLMLDKNLDVAGTLDLQAGGALHTLSMSGVTGAVSHYVLTGNQFTMAAGSTLGIGEAAGITTSGATGSIQTTSRTFAADASYIYGSVATAPAQSFTGNGLPGTVRKLSVAAYAQSGAIFTLSTLFLSQPVSVSQQLDLYAGLNTQGNALTLLSTPSSTAIVGAIAGTLTGTLTVQRAIDPSLNPGTGYRHFSNPLNSGPTFSVNRSGNFSPVVNPAYNTSATPNLVTPFPNLFTYDFTAIASSPATTYSNFDKGWRAIAPGDAAVPRGKGFIANIAASNVLRFVGALSETNQTVPVPANAGPDQGWMLLGNPFAAPIDATQITRPASVPAAVYVFESTGQYAGRYRSAVNGVGNSPIVPVGQGFFMSQSPGGAPGAIVMPTSARQTTYSASTPNLKRDSRPQVQLALTGAARADDLIVYCQTGATNGYDAAFDALKLPSPGQVELAALAGNSALSIAGLPLLNTARATVVPLRVALPQAGTFVLEAASIVNLNNTDVYLLDAVTGQRVNLKQQPRYSFSAAAGTLVGRFALQLGAAGALATASASLAAEVMLYPNPAHNAATVWVPAVAGAATVQATVVDALGRSVHQQTAAATAAGTALTLRTDGLTAGVYTVRLTVGEQTLSKRLVVE